MSCTGGVKCEGALPQPSGAQLRTSSKDRLRTDAGALRKISSGSTDALVHKAHLLTLKGCSCFPLLAFGLGSGLLRLHMGTVEQEGHKLHHLLKEGSYAVHCILVHAG